MLKAIIILLILLSGCSKGITTSCDDITCNFNNAGSENVSTCGYIVLTPKNGVLNITDIPPMVEIGKGYISTALNSGTDEQLLKSEDFLKGAPTMMTNEKIAFSINEICSGVVKSSSNSQITHNSKFGFGNNSVSYLCNGNGGCNIDFVPKEKLVSIIRKQF